MKSQNILVRKNPVYENCPSCKESNSLNRSKARNIFERVVKYFTFYKIYRCKKCGWRGYKPTITVTSGSVFNLFFYIGLIVVVAIIVFQILKRFI